MGTKACSNEALIPPEWIEQPNFDVVVGVEGSGSGVIALCVHVIEQKSDPNSPVCSFQQAPCKNLSGEIVVQQIILSVDCFFSNRGERETRSKRLLPVADQTDPGTAVAGITQFPSQPCKMCARRLDQRIGRGLLERPVASGAPRKNCEEQPRSNDCSLCDNPH